MTQGPFLCGGRSKRLHIDQEQKLASPRDYCHVGVDNTPTPPLSVQ